MPIFIENVFKCGHGVENHRANSTRAGGLRAEYKQNFGLTVNGPGRAARMLTAGVNMFVFH